MRALIAEDETHLAADLQRRLNRLWPQLDIVAVVHDGLAAQRALRDLVPDIAFLDIRMPGMSGLDAAQSAMPGCRVVFVTAHDEHAVAAFEQAAVDYLLKPVSDARLEKLHRTLAAGIAEQQNDDLLSPSCKICWAPPSNRNRCAGCAPRLVRMCDCLRWKMSVSFRPRTNTPTPRRATATFCCARR
jgi:DNA-binding LytR/AlgR family response regulator